jgi:nicotinamide riboside transporter PnuC
MNTIYLHLPRVHAHRVIDITPMPWWPRAARAALALLIFVVVVPLLWLLGLLFALALLGGAAAMLAGAMVRMWQLDRAARRSADSSWPSKPDPAS